MYMSLRTENLMFYRRNDGKQREFIMKKLRFLGIIAAIAIIGLSTVSCEFGGSLTIKNNTGATITAYAVSIESLTDIPDATKTIENGKSYTWDFSLDGEVNWLWAGIGGSTLGEKGKVSISGGKSEVITAK